MTKHCKNSKKNKTGAVKKTHSSIVKRNTSINEIDDIGNFRIIYEIINIESFENKQILTNDPQFLKVIDYDFLKLASSIFFELRPNYFNP